MVAVAWLGTARTCSLNQFQVCLSGDLTNYVIFHSRDLCAFRSEEDVHFNFHCKFVGIIIYDHL